MNIDHPAITDISGLKALWAAAFEDAPAFINCFFDTAFAPERCMCITQDGIVLAAAYWFNVEFNQQTAAYIYAVATAPAHRGQGLCRQLMEAIHEKLQSQGCACAILVPGNGSLRQMYAAMGYQDFGGMTETALSAGKQATPVTQISFAEFATLRRDWLPEGGVIQEGENLAFLKHFYRFYRGDNCLLAAASTGCELFAAEFLGKPEDMPGVLAALGATSGVFRIPGDGPFAMYHPLCRSQSPAYFAFAFD